MKAIYLTIFRQKKMDNADSTLAISLDTLWVKLVSVFKNTLTDMFRDIYTEFFTSSLLLFSLNAYWNI